MQYTLFIGYPLESELKYALYASKEWKADEVLAPSDNKRLIRCSYGETEYVGKRVANLPLGLIDAEKICQEIIQQLEGYHVPFALDPLKLRYIPELLIG